MDAGAVVGLVVGILAGVVILFFLLREVMCWYWKINQLVTFQEDILKELKRISGQPGSPVNAAKSSILHKPVTCPSCGAEIPVDSAFCEKCGAKIQEA